MTRVLILRPEPGASATLARARALGLDAIAIPLFAIEPVGWHRPDPSDFDALLLTSANAIRAGGPGLDGLRNLPVYAVGEGTATAARECGLAVAATGQQGVDALLGAIDPSLRLLHLRNSAMPAPRSICCTSPARTALLPPRRNTPSPPSPSIGRANEATPICARSVDAWRLSIPPAPRAGWRRSRRTDR